MNFSDTKLTKKHKGVVLTVFLIMLVLALGVTALYFRNNLKDEQNRASLNAQIHADRIQQDFQRGIEITDALERIIIDNQGKINDFDTAATDMMEEEYISSIQLAPKGKVSYIYPYQGNEAGMIDLFDDPIRGKVVQYSVTNNVVTMQGPFELKQGGEGIAVRNPIFLSKKDGSKTFWGFSIVIIKTPEIYAKSVKNLEDFGFDYCLDATVLPLTKEPKRVASSIGEKETLKGAEKASFQVGGCEWTLAVKPQVASGSYRVISVGLGLLFVTLLITFMTYLLMLLYEQRNQLNSLAMKDELTGLLSRRGFMLNLDKILRDKETSLMTSVFMDLDDFKAINDVHGHVIGDVALKHLADELTAAFGPYGIVGRTGGDEFCVLLVGKTPQESREMIEALVAKKHEFSVGEGKYTFTISAGYACYPTQASDRMNLMILADEALYAAKLDGKNNSKQYEPAMADIKRTQLGFSIKSFSSGLPGAILVYRATGDEQILYANEEMFELTGCRDFNEFLEFTDSHFSGFVHPDDRKRVNEEIWKQIDEQRLTEEPGSKLGDLVEYKILTKDGSVKDVIDVGRMVHDENYGDIFFVFVREKLIR